LEGSTVPDFKYDCEHCIRDKKILDIN